MDFRAGVVIQRDIQTRQPLPDIAIAQADGYIVLPVSTFNSINSYIDQILEKLGDNNVKVSPQDIRQVKTKLNLLVEDLHKDSRIF